MATNNGRRHNADGTDGMYVFPSRTYDTNNNRRPSVMYTPTKKKSKVGLGAVIVGGLIAAALFLKP